MYTLIIILILSCTISLDSRLQSKPWNSYLIRPKIQLPFTPYFPIHTLNTIRQYIVPNRLNDSTLLHAASVATKVSPPWNAPSFVWTLAWKMHTFFMPILHAFDKCSTKDTCWNLAVLWWKAISGNRWGSSTYDNGVAYDLLPPVTRSIVRFPFCWLFPNLHHQNVALRTAFLDNAVREELKSNDNMESMETKIIVIGAGFDTRALRFLEADNSTNCSWYEFDLPSVVEQKRLLLQRYRSRRPLRNLRMPELLSVDLNDPVAISMHLTELFEAGKDMETANTIKRNRKSDKIKTIFIIEAVLIYLNKDLILPLLETCVKSVTGYSSSVSLCFADRLPGIITNHRDPKVEYEEAVQLFNKLNMQLIEFLPKPGRARHMGVARYKF